MYRVRNLNRGRPMRNQWSWIAACVLFCVAPAGAAEKLTEHTLKLSAGEKPPAATLADMKWLEGRWIGEAFGGKTEEFWSAAEGGAMVGWFRLINKGKPVFYEILTEAEHEGSLVIRLKHFHADLKGWEEKNEVQEFRLVAKAAGAMHLDRKSVV